MFSFSAKRFVPLPSPPKKCIIIKAYSTTTVRDLVIITSDFHMPRTKAIFDWVFRLPRWAADAQFDQGKYSILRKTLTDWEEKRAYSPSKSMLNYCFRKVRARWSSKL
jgi:hypothetical protein